LWANIAAKTKWWVAIQFCPSVNCAPAFWVIPHALPGHAATRRILIHGGSEQEEKRTGI
jgi:hypothetical protein